jgi:hypothetical protein
VQRCCGPAAQSAMGASFCVACLVPCPLALLCQAEDLGARLAGCRLCWPGLSGCSSAAAKLAWALFDAQLLLPSCCMSVYVVASTGSYGAVMPLGVHLAVRCLCCPRSLAQLVCCPYGKVALHDTVGWL